MSTAIGPRADTAVIRDLEGKLFVIGPREEIVAALASGSSVSVDATDASTPTMLPQRLQREMDAVLRWLGFEDTARETTGIVYGSTKAGSTTSAVKVGFPYLANDATGGGTLIILDGIARPAYAIATITGHDTVNLTGAMSEAAPATGVSVRVCPAVKPTPSASDFPSGKAFGVKDGSGNWYVIDPSSASFKVYRASLSGTTLSKVASGSGTLTLKVGAVAGNGNITVTIKPQGNWDWSDATVTGISTGGTGTIGVTFDGEGSTIAEGTIASVYVPYAFQLLGVDMLADDDGNIVVNIASQLRSGYTPHGFSDIHDAPPQIASDDEFSDTTLTGYTTSFSAGTVLQFQAVGVTAFTRLTVTLTVRKL